MKDHFLIRKPIVTERAADLNKIGQYVFMVAPEATKNEIKKAVKDIYKVEPVAVNVIYLPSKSRRYRGKRGRRGGYKKAIVTLKSGQKIDIAA